MRVYGLDFTSAPRKAKPITCAACDFDGDRLRLDSLDAFADFEQFETFLQLPGPWIAGFDFPFGQPAELIRNLGWGKTWADYVGRVGCMSKAQFVAAITDYCATRPPGNKFHYRHSDILAGSCSPMMLYGVPVGRMFFQGAPRLLAPGASVIRATQPAAIAWPSRRTRRWSYGAGSRSGGTRPTISTNRRRNRPRRAGTLSAVCARHAAIRTASPWT